MISFDCALTPSKKQKCDVKQSKTIFDSGNIWTIVFPFLSRIDVFKCPEVCKSWKFHVIPEKIFSNPEVRVQEFIDYWYQHHDRVFLPKAWKDLFLKKVACIPRLRLEQNEQFKITILSKALMVNDLTLETISNKVLEVLSHLPLTSLSITDFYGQESFTSKTLQSFWKCKTLQNLDLYYQDDLFSFDSSAEVFPNLKSLTFKCHNIAHTRNNIHNLGNFKSITSLNYSTEIRDTVLTHEMISKFPLLTSASIEFREFHRSNYPADLINLASSLSLETLNIKQCTHLDNNAEIQLLHLLSLGRLKSINYTFYDYPLSNMDMYFDTKIHQIFNRDEVTVTLEYFNFSEISKYQQMESQIKNLYLVFHINRIEEDKDPYADCFEGDSDYEEELIAKNGIDCLEGLDELKSIKLIFKAEISPRTDEEENCIYFLDKHSDLIHSVQSIDKFVFTPNILTQLRKKPLKNCSHLEGPFCKKRSHLFHSISTKELRIYFPNFKQLIRPVFYDDFEFC